MSSVGIRIRRAAQELNGRAVAHRAGLMPAGPDSFALILPIPARAHAAAYNQRLMLSPRGHSS
jgi:hypothetical protein